MKRGVILLVVLCLVSTAEAGFFFEGSVWDAWLSGNVVDKGFTSSNKDLELVELLVDKEKSEVLAKVCNAGNIGLNFNNLNFAAFTINGKKVYWNYPMSRGYEDTVERRLVTSSTFYFGACMLLAQPFAADAEQLSVSVAVDPDEKYVESDEENNALTQIFLLRDVGALPFVEVEVTNDSEVAVPVVEEKVQVGANQSGVFASLVIFLGVIGLLVFFLVHKRKQPIVRRKNVAH